MPATAWSVDRYSNWPASVQKLPQVGGGLDPSVEAIVALRPDVVLMANPARRGSACARWGWKEALEPKTRADVGRASSLAWARCCAPGADALMRQIDAGVAAAAQSVPAAARGSACTSRSPRRRTRPGTAASSANC